VIVYWETGKIWGCVALCPNLQEGPPRRTLHALQPGPQCRPGSSPGCRRYSKDHIHVGRKRVVPDVTNSSSLFRSQPSWSAVACARRQGLGLGRRIQSVVGREFTAFPLFPTSDENLQTTSPTILDRSSPPETSLSFAPASRLASSMRHPQSLSPRHGGPPTAESPLPYGTLGCAACSDTAAPESKIKFVGFVVSKRSL